MAARIPGLPDLKRRPDYPSALRRPEPGYPPVDGDVSARPGRRRRMPGKYQDYDRIAVVTGSDSGIGEAIAVALARAGFDVGVTWRSDDAGAKSTAEKVRTEGRRCEVRRLDLTALPDASGVVDELA